MKMKNLTAVTALITIHALLLPTAAMAGTYQCERAAVPSTFTSNGPPRGDWQPWHDTSKWSYRAVQGNDVYQHNRRNSTIPTLCKRDLPSSWDLGTRYNDYKGLEDACGVWSEAVAYSQAASFCSAGFAKSGDGGSCSTPSSPRTFVISGRPKINGILLNEANFDYIAVAKPAEDFFRRKTRPRNVVSAVCHRGGPGGWALGLRENDFIGLNDMCGEWVEAVPPVTAAAQCPAGHALVYKP